MLAETITEWTEQWKAEGATEGHKEGRIEEKFNTIKKLSCFNMPLEQISSVVNISVDKIKTILAEGESGIDLIHKEDLT